MVHIDRKLFSCLLIQKLKFIESNLTCFNSKSSDKASRLLLTSSLFIFVSHLRIYIISQGNLSIFCKTTNQKKLLVQHIFTLLSLRTTVPVGSDIRNSSLVSIFLFFSSFFSSLQFLISFCIFFNIYSLLVSCPPTQGHP
jgi:hypothetical protein